jgi:hypothetical protein
MLKKVLFTAIPAFVMADISSSTFYSIYDGLDGNSGFRNAQSYYLENGQYRLNYSSANRESTNQYHLYSKNFRMFLPNYTTGFKLFFQRKNSTGWFDVIVSLEKLPVKDFGAASTEDDLLNQLLNYDSIAYQKETALNLQDYEVPSGTNLNKWLYVRTDTTGTSRESREDILPDATSDVTTANVYNSLQYIVLSMRTYLDKDLVDSYVSQNSLDTKYSSDCQSESDDVKNLCYYVKSFGEDGTDSDISTHYVTSGSASDIVLEAEETHFDMKLIDGWNLLGSSETITDISSKFDGVQNVWVFDNNQWTQNPTTIKAGQGFWLQK